MYVDSHCHIHFPALAKRLPEVLSNMKKNSVSHALVVSISLNDIPDVLKLCEQHDNLYAAVGVHPGRKENKQPDVKTLVEYAKHPKVVAIGETGLDYHHVKGDRDWQFERFRIQIRASRECGKPLIIHAREAADDVIRVLKEEGAGTDAGGYGGIMHCFNETMPIAKAAMEMGFYISFSGVITYPNARELQHVARLIPLNRILIETDAPYLSPQSIRGKQNEPAYVSEVAAQLAKIKGVPVARIARESAQNFFRLFGLTHLLEAEKA
ncbi:TatD family hydrolase [Oxalobacter vibrioformis]|uniref:TatD family hydrolase n=1 Tax=Oxalobacter vibrioformis TaxID=933080 RepID=A0A9E9P3F9_9BURK|nr:TatD family hydrolase [Oxalobacter vibrioformis]NLC24865.1 TatD family hydrolase [Oxalobacter sp.]WAW09958.1 TatD family hydrolase [Oxalobacter vibrioformis]